MWGCVQLEESWVNTPEGYSVFRETFVNASCATDGINPPYDLIQKVLVEGWNDEIKALQRIPHLRAGTKRNVGNKVPALELSI